MRNKGLKAASLAGVNRTVSAVLSQAMDDNLLSANPAFRMGKYLSTGDDLQAVHARRSAAAARRGADEWAALSPRASDDGGPDGDADGELLALQWGDFNLVEGFVDVQRPSSRERLTTLKRSKNRGKLRRVNLSPQLVETWNAIACS